MTATIARVPRDVFCVVDHLHRSVAVAQAACSGRFTNCSVTLDIGAPDWMNVAVHPDREWWIEWSKFYFGLDLAFAFTVSGDLAYVRTWERLVGSWIAQVPVDFGPTDALARRLQNWIYAWLRFATSPKFAGFDSDFEARLVETVGAHADYLQRHLTPERNHRTLELYALFTTALAFPETDANAARLDFAWDALRENLLTDCRPDGVHREHSTHYHMVALRSWIGARENARRFGLAVPAAYDERLARAVEFAMHCQRPDGSIPMLSDSDTADYRDVLALAARLLNRPDAAYVATNGREGEAPSHACAAFTQGGYYVQRSEWSSGPGRQSRGRHLVFDCGSIGDGGHGHYDLLSIDAWAGQPIVVDPGRYTYAEGTPNWRHWFKGTAAHNTVCVDGLDQTTYRCGKPRSQPATGRLVAAVDAPSFNLAAGEARTSRYDAVHRRYVAFIAGDYWIVWDSMVAADAHDYDVRFNLGAAAWERTVVGIRHVSAPGVDLLFDGPGKLALEPGWVAPRYGVKQPAPIASLRIAGRANASVVTALMPRDDDGAAVGLAAAHASPEEIHVRISGRTKGHSDHLVLTADGLPYQLGDWSVVATSAWTRTAESGEIIARVFGGVRVVTPTTTRRTFEWIAELPGRGLQTSAERIDR